MCKYAFYISIYICIYLLAASRLFRGLQVSTHGPHTYGLYWGGVSSSNLHASRRGREESLAWLRLGLGKAGGSCMGWWGCQEERTPYFSSFPPKQKTLSKVRFNNMQ